MKKENDILFQKTYIFAHFEKIMQASWSVPLSEKDESLQKMVQNVSFLAQKVIENRSAFML